MSSAGGSKVEVRDVGFLTVHFTALLAQTRHRRFVAFCRDSMLTGIDLYRLNQFAELALPAPRVSSFYGSHLICKKKKSYFPALSGKIGNMERIVFHFAETLQMNLLLISCLDGTNIVVHSISKRKPCQS